MDSGPDRYDRRRATPGPERYRRGMRRTATVLLLLTAALGAGLSVAQATEPAYETSLDFAQVQRVDVTVGDDGALRFDVTVRHADDGWEHYADAWQVIDPETGEVHAERELLHPHDQEQPFTRSLSGVRLPDGVTTVTVRARCNVHGFGGREVVVDLTTSAGDGYAVHR